MKQLKLFMLMGMMAFIMSSCSPQLTPFTQNLYEQNQWSDDDLKQIQFYLSEDIVLRRNISSGSTEIVSGEIKMVDGKKVEEVVIRRGTPGIMLFKPKEKRIAVSFEDGNDSRFLMFGPNPKARNRYVLLASDWDRKKGKITYDDKAYYTSGSNAYATLMVDLKRTRKVSVRSRTAKGRKL